MDDKTPIYVIKLAGIMFVTTLAAMVAMSVSGQDTASIERIVGPLLSSVIVVGVVGAITHAQNGKLDEQTQELTKIKEQTNGVLDARIRRATQAALLELQAAEQTGAHATPLEEPGHRAVTADARQPQAEGPETEECVSDSNIVQKVNKSSLGSRQARTLRASVPVTRARAAIAQAQAQQTARQPVLDDLDEVPVTPLGGDTIRP